MIYDLNGHLLPLERSFYESLINISTTLIPLLSDYSVVQAILHSPHSSQNLSGS